MDERGLVELAVFELGEAAEQADALSAALRAQSERLVNMAKELRAAIERLRFPVPGIVVDLPVPYFSQWDRPGEVDGVPVDADRSPGDCGPACIAMWLHFASEQHRPTVDEAAIAAGQTPGGRYTTINQLYQAARHFGLELEWARPLGLARIREELDDGRPALLLIHYGALEGRQDQNYRAGHFVLAVGYGEDEGGPFFLLNDPDWWGSRRDEGDHWRVDAEQLDEALASCYLDGNTPYQGLIVSR